MKTVTLDEVSGSLEQMLDEICQSRQPLAISRQPDESVVVLSLADYNSMAETLYLLGSEKSAAWLRESVAQHKT